MNEQNWHISLSGRAWAKDEAFARHNLIDHACRIEMVGGKLLWDDEDRVTLLALLLENVGALRATKIGDPAVWRAAIAALDPA